jgi:uncharacterized repeat protein (TIGR01451 family)
MKSTGGRILFLFLVISALSFSGRAATVYFMQTGTSPTDVAALRALEAGGHTVILGVQAQQWNGTQADLNNFDAVVILNSHNASSGSMPRGGTSALIKYVFNGGGIVTGELFNANADRFNRHVGAEALLPVTAPQSNVAASTIYRQETPDPILNDGLPESFTFSLQNVFSAETSFTLRPDAIVFYSSSNGGGRANSPGFAGWNILNGKVLSFSTNITDTELASENYQRLLSNAVNWVTRTADIAVTKVASADTVPSGSNISYTITFSNNGPNPALPVTLTDELPAETTFQSLDVPAGWFCATPKIGEGGTITCTITTWNIYSTSIFTLVVNVNGKTPAGTIISNTVNVSAPAIDPNPDNNSATAAVTVTAP